MRILIVDDCEMARNFAAFPLREAGHEVVEAGSGEEALGIIESQGIRLIITDWMMPGMSGPDLCRRIRSLSSSYAYLILVTAREGVAATVEGLEAGADDFIVKPYDSRELLARVRTGQRVLALETRDLMIFALARLAESRDPETSAHLERVQAFSTQLSITLRDVGSFPEAIDDAFIQEIRLTSPLHDIGKIGVPDCVLLKAGRLDDNEFELMKTHTDIGARCLESVLEKNPDARFLAVARDIAAYHHERYDGMGYPRGLVGEKIPLAARIVAVADIYDALTSKRVYKDAFTHEVARSIIVAGRGSQFDPKVIDAFRLCERRFIEISHDMLDRDERRSQPEAA